MPLWGNTDSAGDEPKYAAHHESMDTSNLTVYGVDDTEVGLARTTAYSVTHGGWVGITSYTDMHGNQRVKAETLVAINIASGDQTDDGLFRDS